MHLDIAFPVVSILAAVAFAGLLVYTVKKNDDLLYDKSGIALLVLGAAQALFATFGLFTHNLVQQSYGRFAVFVSARFHKVRVRTGFTF